MFVNLRMGEQIVIEYYPAVKKKKILIHIHMDNLKKNIKALTIFCMILFLWNSRKGKEV